MQRAGGEARAAKAEAASGGRRKRYMGALTCGPGVSATQGRGKAACGACCVRLGRIGPAVVFLAGRRAGLCGLSWPAGEEGVVGYVR